MEREILTKKQKIDQNQNKIIIQNFDQYHQIRNGLQDYSNRGNQQNGNHKNRSKQSRNGASEYQKISSNQQMQENQLLKELINHKVFCQFCKKVIDIQEIQQSQPKKKGSNNIKDIVYPKYCVKCQLQYLDPFHKVESTVIDCRIINSTEFKQEFHFTQQQQQQLKSQKCQLEIRCINPQFPSEITYPKDGSISINNNTIHQLKPLQSNSSLKKRRDEKQIIKPTKYRLSGRNQLQIQLNDQDLKDLSTNKYYFSLVIVTVQDQDIVINNFKLKRQIKPYKFQKLIIDSLSKNPNSSKNIEDILQEEDQENDFQLNNSKDQEQNNKKNGNCNDVDDEDVLIQNTQLSLMCNLTMMKMITPAKGKFCQHNQPFGLESFVQIMKTTTPRKWKCPICKLQCWEVYVDTFFVQILKKSEELPDSEDIQEVTFNKEGEYTFEKEGQKDDVFGNGENLDLIDEDQKSNHTLSDPIPSKNNLNDIKKQQSNGNQEQVQQQQKQNLHQNQIEQKKQLEIIDDEDEEEEEIIQPQVIKQNSINNNSNNSNHIITSINNTQNNNNNDYRNTNIQQQKVVYANQIDVKIVNQVEQFNQQSQKVQKAFYQQLHLNNQYNQQQQLQQQQQQLQQLQQQQQQQFQIQRVMPQQKIQEEQKQQQQKKNEVIEILSDSEEEEEQQQQFQQIQQVQQQKPQSEQKRIENIVSNHQVTNNVVYYPSNNSNNTVHVKTNQVLTQRQDNLPQNKQQQIPQVKQQEQQQQDYVSTLIGKKSNQDNEDDEKQGLTSDNAICIDSD